MGRAGEGPLESGEENVSALTNKVCRIPGDKPVVRVEGAPGNARRVFTGIDVRASVEDVWAVMTDYKMLETVVPNLIENKIMARLEHGGARLWQIGRSSWQLFGRKFYFQAGTTLDVRLHPTGMGNSGVKFAGESLDAASISTAAAQAHGKGLKMVRDTFPQPFSIAAPNVPIRDITMQNVTGERSDFVHYQAVWRLQPLQACAAPGEDLMRLTFAMECEPHWFLPVAPVESRIAAALAENMEAIRDYVETKVACRIKAESAAEAGDISALALKLPSQRGLPLRRAKEVALWDQVAEWIAERTSDLPSDAQFKPLWAL